MQPNQVLKLIYSKFILAILNLSLFIFFQGLD